MIAMPIFFYILGADALATKIMYLASALVILSQVPKRFVWRYRPFMGDRAIEIQSTKTSSFPSRAVACSVVYCYVVAWIYKDYLSLYNYYWDWWMIVLLILFPLLLSFARINLGVHYPSDCVAGIILGLLACAIGRILIFADGHGCSCVNDDFSSNIMCYSNNSNIHTITPQNFELNWTVVACVIVGQILFALFCILKPMEFWVKFGAVFGLLFPALTFRLVFLCPSPSSLSSLPPTLWFKSFDIISCVYGLAVVVIGMVIGMKLQKKLLFWVFVIYWIFYMFVILFWRLYLQYHAPHWPN